MSLIENLRGRSAKAAQAQAPEVLRRLNVAEAELAELEAQHGTAALDAIVGDAGGADRLATLNRDLTKAREGVNTLRAAHRAAVERDEEAVRAQREAIRKTQIAAMRKHLEARDAAAVALCAAIAEVAKHYHTLIDRSAKARAACPVGESWPVNTMCEPDPLRRAVQHEFFRLSATPGNRDGRALPGALLPHVNAEWNPEAVTPLADTVKQATAYTLTKLTDKAPE